MSGITFPLYNVEDGDREMVCLDVISGVRGRHTCVGSTFSLYDVEDGDIAVIRLAMDRCGHHHVLWLQKSPHDIKNSRLTDTGHLYKTYTVRYISTIIHR